MSPPVKSIGDTPSEMPEHREDLRRFVVWAVMLGVASSERLTERCIPELERELAETSWTAAFRGFVDDDHAPPPGFGHEQALEPWEAAR